MRSEIMPGLIAWWRITPAVMCRSWVRSRHRRGSEFHPFRGAKADHGKSDRRPGAPKGNQRKGRSMILSPREEKLKTSRLSLRP